MIEIEGPTIGGTRADRPRVDSVGVSDTGVDDGNTKDSIITEGSNGSKRTSGIDDPEDGAREGIREGIRGSGVMTGIETLGKAS